MQIGAIMAMLVGIVVRVVLFVTRRTLLLPANGQEVPYRRRHRHPRLQCRGNRRNLLPFCRPELRHRQPDGGHRSASARRCLSPQRLLGGCPPGTVAAARPRAGRDQGPHRYRDPPPLLATSRLAAAGVACLGGRRRLLHGRFAAEGPSAGIRRRRRHPSRWGSLRRCRIRPPGWATAARAMDNRRVSRFPATTSGGVTPSVRSAILRRRR